MSMLQLPLEETAKDYVPGKNQIIMVVKNVDPLKPEVQFFPPRCVKDGRNPFDIDLSTVTGGKEEDVRIRVILLQDNLDFMIGQEDVTAGCQVSQKYLRRLSPSSTKPAKDVEFLVCPLAPSGPEVLFNLGLVASGTELDCDGKPIGWSVPIVIDPKITNME